MTDSILKMCLSSSRSTALSSLSIQACFPSFRRQHVERPSAPRHIRTVTVFSVSRLSCFLALTYTFLCDLLTIFSSFLWHSLRTWGQL